MMQRGSKIVVVDNSGAKKIQIINLLKKNKKNRVTIGDIVITAIKSTNTKNKNLLSQVCPGVITEVKSKNFRKNGSNFKSDRSAMILLNSQNEPLGTRISGLIGYELKLANSKIITISSNNI